VIALLVGLAWGQADVTTTDPAGRYVDALKAEIERSSTLELPDAPPLYALRYRLAMLEQHSLTAEMGSVLREDRQPYNALGVELRVGTPDYDNTGFGGWEDGFVRGGLALEPTPHSLRRTAWLLTDRAYKQAVEQFARKSAQFEAPDDYPGDWQPPEPSIANEGWARLSGAPELAEQVVRLSEVFRPLGPELSIGRVVLGQEAGGVLLVDAAGTEIRRPMEEVSIRAFVHLRTDDGQLLTDSRYWCVRQPDGLPSEDAMRAELVAMRDAIEARADAPKLDEEYVGPVLFEADAAVDVFRYLLTPQLEGTPSEIPYDSWFGDLGERQEAVRVGRRVLPEGWTAVDDPRGDEGHPSFMTLDWEGTPTRSVPLVEDGIVRDLLMNRVPRRIGGEVRGSNGHARGFLGTRSKARVTQLTVTPPKTTPRRKMVKKGLKMAAAYGRDHVLVVRRLQEDAVRAAASDATVFDLGGEDALSLPPPVEVVRMFADGREEVLRGARFASIQRFVLRDIALAGESMTRPYLAPVSGDYSSLGPTEGLATQLTAPSILVREVELVPTNGDPRDTPVLTPPPVE
jgi:predicted Zn-dependent protease